MFIYHCQYFCTLSFVSHLLILFLKKSVNLHFLGVYYLLAIISAYSYGATSLQDGSH